MSYFWQNGPPPRPAWYLRLCNDPLLTYHNNGALLWLTSSVVRLSSAVNPAFVICMEAICEQEQSWKKKKKNLSVTLHFMCFQMKER